MEYRDEKRRLFESLVAEGVTAKEAAQFHTVAPPSLHAKWIRNFYRGDVAVRLTDTPRLLNRFSIGADPELVFLDTTGRYFFAQAIGMDTLSAFGADLSG